MNKPYEQRDMTFSLFVNDRKVKETDYDYTGTALINGVAYFVNAWKKDNGKLIMNGNFKAKNLGKPSINKPAPIHLDGNEDDFGDIPF